MGEEDGENSSMKHSVKCPEEECLNIESEQTLPRKRKKVWREVDGLYGWVVTFASVIIFMFSGGVFYSGGIVVPELLSAFPDAGRVAATLIISVKFALMNFCCLFAGCLTEVYGCRNVSIIGGAFVALGFISSAFVKVFGVLYVTYSLFLGLGLALQFVPCIVMVQQYFTKKRTLASGILNAGSSVGVFIFAVLIRWLMDTFSWRGTLLLMGGLNLNALPLSWLLKKPKNLKTDESVEQDLVTSEKSDGEVHIKKSSFAANIKKTLWTLTTSIKELSEAKIALSFLACFLKCLEYNVPYVFLPMKITDLGYTPWHAAMAVASMGVGDLLGRLFVSAVGSIEKVSNILFYSIVLLLGGMTEVTSGLLSDFHALCVCGFFTAAFSGMFIALRPPVLVDLVGIDRVARIFGLMNIGDGFGNLAGLPLLAYLHRHWGNINIAFFSCSVGPIIASCLIFIIYMMPHSKKETI